MSFNYNKQKSGEDSGSFWTSYSDLFLGMSVVFLLLYVTASLRQGTNGIQQQLQNQKLTTQVQDLKNQLKMYDSVKKDYLKNEAKPEEEKLYNELMDKLTLLKEEAKDEKERLAQASLDNEKKEKALNQYQQMVRNIVNANLMAKTKIKKRDDVITEQDDEIDSQESEIAKLEQDITNKKKQIAENKEKIAEANEQLQDRLSELKKAYKQKKMSEAAYERKVEKLKEESENKLAQLKANAQAFQSQLAQTQTKLNDVSGELDKTKTTLAKTENENKQLESKLSSAQEEYNKKVGELKRGFADQATKDRMKFEGELAKERMSGAERARREAAFKAMAAQKERELGQKIAALGGELSAKENELKAKEGALAAKEGQLAQASGALKAKEGQLAKAAGALKEKEGALAAKEGQLRDTEGLLAKARAEADARKQIAKDIREGFKKVGVDADINDKTGEVVINFGDVYFDNDSSKLKEKMREVLKKAMPVYSKSLLGNKKTSDKISAVEIIGFASPTFQGKYVDPSKIDGQSRKAIDYNLDLSYNRARAIFQYIFDENKLQFEHQKDMLPLIKVTGRSFLADKLPNKRSPSGNADFCATHDCKKAQRVIIRFSFDDKK